MCLHFDQIRPWRRCLKHTFFGLYIDHVKFLKTVFIAFNRKMISFFWFSLKLRSFLSLCFFRFSIMCHRVFNKTIILLRLAGYEMIITNSALRASLVTVYIISYPAHPHRIIVKYIYLTIILRGRTGYEMIYNQRGA